MKVKIIIFVLIVWETHVNIATYPTCPPENGPGEAIHFPHPADCTKFVTCDWGKEVVRDCAPGTLWNDVVKTCDHPSNVECSAGSTIIPNTPTRSYRTSPPTVTTRTIAFPTMRPSTNGGCPRILEANDPIFMPHWDCSRFYLCTPKGPLEYRCNEGYHWSIKTDRCENPREAWCVTSCPDGYHWSAKGCLPITESGTSSSIPGTVSATAMITQATSAASTKEPIETDDYFTTDSYSDV